MITRTRERFSGGNDTHLRLNAFTRVLRQFTQDNPTLFNLSTFQVEFKPGNFNCRTF